MKYTEDSGDSTLAVYGKIILNWITGKVDAEIWIEFIWPRIGTGGMLL
jgi:hypothetical protein